jgi:hypothetical protein
MAIDALVKRRASLLLGLPGCGHVAGDAVVRYLSGSDKRNGFVVPFDAG